MLSLSHHTSEMETDRDSATASAVIAQPKCYGITIFTLQYNAVRDFYVDLLNARVMHFSANLNGLGSRFPR